MEKVRIDEVSNAVQPAAVMRHLTEPLGLTDVAINYYELEQGDSFALAYHNHEVQEEVFYVQARTPTFETEDGPVTVEAGEIVRFDRREFQRGWNRGDERVVAIADIDEIEEQHATYFDQTFNRGRLQRATRWEAFRPEGDYPLPLEPEAGGEHGQAAVYNAEIQYDTAADEWTVTDDAFHTAGSLYLSNQDLWASIWGGSEFPGRGVPGQSDRLPRWQDERSGGE